MVDQGGDPAEQQTDPYERLDPAVVDEAYLTQAWWNAHHGEGQFGGVLQAEALLNREALLVGLRDQIGALYEKSNSEDGSTYSADEWVAEYRTVFERVGHQVSIEELKKFVALREPIKTGQPILDEGEDEVFFVADNDGTPTLQVDEARDDDLEKPQRYLSWSVEVRSVGPEKTTVLVDYDTPVGKEAIIDRVKASLRPAIKDSYLSMDDYLRALTIFETIDAKDEIEELKGDAASSALANLKRISPNDYDSSISRHLDLLSFTDAEAFQELLDSKAKRIANNGVPRREDMIFYSALSMHQEANADDAFDEPYRLHAMFDLYESEHQRGIELEAQEKLAEEAKSFAH